MNKTYLLDTNALFNYVKYKITYSSLDTESQKIIDELEGNKCYISEITTIEIVSVLGKYARGGLGAAKKMKTKQIKAWKKLIDQILNQDKENDFKIEIIQFDRKVLKKANKIIQSAYKYSFASTDAIIAATACIYFDSIESKDKYIVTSDKSLICALSANNIPYWNAFICKV